MNLNEHEGPPEASVSDPWITAQLPVRTEMACMQRNRTKLYLGWCLGRLPLPVTDRQLLDSVTCIRTDALTVSVGGVSAALLMRGEVSGVCESARMRRGAIVE